MEALTPQISSNTQFISDWAKRRILEQNEKTSRVLAAIRYLTSNLYPAQHALLTDPGKRKVVLTPRQVGKTFTLARYLLLGALQSPSERAVVAYCTDTRDHAHDLVWRPLLDALDATGIDYTPHIVDLDVTVHTPHGDRTISLFGVDDERKARRLRGYQYFLFIVDEAQSIPDAVLKRLLEEDVSAGLGAWDGTLLLCGTPGPVLAGTFYEASTQAARYHYRLFRWTHDDNVYFPRWRGKPGWQDAKNAWLEQEKVGRSEAAWRREYLGVWAADASAYCLHLSERNEPTGDDLTSLPCVLGIDLGWTDATALVVLSIDRPRRMLHVRHYESHTGMGLEALTARVQALVAEFQPIRTVMDSAGAGKIIQESMSRQLADRYGLAIKPAQKQDKAVHIAILDNTAQQGRFRCPRGELWGHLAAVQKDPVTGIEVKTAKCDLFDALLYASREGYEYIQEPEPVYTPQTEDDLILEGILGRERPDVLARMRGGNGR